MGCKPIKILMLSHFVVVNQAVCNSGRVDLSDVKEFYLLQHLSHFLCNSVRESVMCFLAVNSFCTQVTFTIMAFVEDVFISRVLLWVSLFQVALRYIIVGYFRFKAW